MRYDESVSFPRERQDSAWLSHVLRPASRHPRSLSLFSHLALMLTFCVAVEAQTTLLTIEPTAEQPRNSEGDIIELKDGRLCLIYTRFSGGTSDHAAADLAMRTSADGGRTWNADKIIVSGDGGGNVMSVSLLRLADGRIALFYLHKRSLEDCRPVMRLSHDECATFSEPTRCINDEVGYYVLNNDRAVQLAGGRLVLPVALHNKPGQEEPDWAGRLMCYLSDDLGKNWRRSQSTLIGPSRDGKRAIVQEPGVVQLTDGRLMMFCRTDSGSQYVSYSTDQGDTWSTLAPSDLISPLSPATIERIPWSGELLSVWNDHSGEHAYPQGKRTPLCAAISQDEGETWARSGLLEDDPEGWYCYTAMTFLRDRVLLAYCAGHNQVGGLNRLKVVSFTEDELARVSAAGPRGLSENGSVSAGEPIDIGSRRELFVDQYLIDRLAGVRLELHRPVRREIVFRTDAAWEGNGSAYQSVFQDGDRFRMYYRGGHHPNSKAYRINKSSWEALCLAESKDGIHWTRPELGIVEFRNSTKNNLILDETMVQEIGGSPAHTAVFKDTNPECPDSERYKIVIVGSKPRGLYLMVSADGIHFRLKSGKPFATAGAFDSQNLMFWDTVGGVYREYHRSFDKGVRGIMTAASKDPNSFPKPQWLKYPGAVEQALYTNQVQPYYRAPHIFMGFPMRYNDLGWSPSMTELPGLEERQYRAKQHPRYGTAVTDAAFMTSRDGVTFRRWGEAFIRPGPARKDTWVYGDNFIFWGIVQTKSHLQDAPDEISVYATEGYWQGAFTSFRRYTLRIDGFVSAQAPLSGGQLVTKPLTFDGSQLEMNFSTSAAGSVRVELQDAAGQPMTGFTLDDCHVQYGDQLDRIVSWKSGSDVGRLAGKVVRLEFELKDADLYSFQFTSKAKP